MHVLRSSAAGAAAILALTVAARAEAFCGFYVSGADNKLFADATQVVLMREGTKTVLSMQNDYKGPPEKFALVIPVPVVLQKDNVKVLPSAIFDKVDKLGAPRLVEYWEQDPCPKDDGLLLGHGAGTGTGQGFGNGAGRLGGAHATDLGVKIESQFAVGEYEIVVLSAQDAAGLDTWLKQEKYAIPSGAEPFFRPYVASGMKFFVAKVDVTKVKMEGGRATLSPLRFHYDSDKFSLPVRLGLINSSGKQDLIVNVLAKRQRYEVANYPNATIPTNLDVAEAARGKFGEFYASLFDKVLEKEPKAVVTEYSWDAGTCDPCPGPTLDGGDLATLGADVLPNGTDGLRGAASSATLRPAETTVKGKLPPEIIQRIVRQNFGRFHLCYEKGLRTNPNLAGKVAVKFTIGSDGNVKSTSDGGSTIADKTVRDCVTAAFNGLSFPQPEGGGTVEVVYPIVFAPTGGSTFRGGMSTPYVLTRMHLRYDAATLGEDLVFRAAEPITGGREMYPSGKLESGAVQSSVNNFQGRYAIRHPWKGPIACKEPRRGVWGGPPAGTPEPTPAAAQKTAFVTRGAALASFVTAPIASLDVRPAPGMPPPPPSADPPVTPDAAAPSSSADAAASGADAGTSPAPAKKGCSLGAGALEGGGAPVLGVAIAIAAARARRRARRA